MKTFQEFLRCAPEITFTHKGLSKESSEGEEKMNHNRDWKKLRKGGRDAPPPPLLLSHSSCLSFSLSFCSTRQHFDKQCKTTMGLSGHCMLSGSEESVYWGSCQIAERGCPSVCGNSEGGTARALISFLLSILFSLSLFLSTYLTLCLFVLSLPVFVSCSLKSSGNFQHLYCE